MRLLLRCRVRPICLAIFGIGLLTGGATGASLPPPPTEPVTLTADRSLVVTTSQLSVGVTETHVSADHKDAKPAAVARGRALLEGVSAYQNTHIQAWGVGVIEPKPGVYDWASMDRRMAFLRQAKTPIIITLCSAPGWMKTSGKDWEIGDPIAPAHNADFAALCVKIAERYPDVRTFQVWNEFKGYWNKATNEWDVEGYTAMYNTVYDALKKHDAKLKIGGFYLVVAGTGSATIGRTGLNTDLAITERQKKLLRYWTANRHGADFVCADKGIPDYHDHNQYTPDELLSLTPTYEKITRELHDLSGGLPVWWSEFYSVNVYDDVNVTGAAYASAYIHALLGGASTALVWNPNQGELNCYLYTDVRKADGGKPTPCYEAFKIIAQHFGPGTPIVQTTSSSPWVELLAAKDGSTLVVSKWAKPLRVTLDGKTMTLKPYAIELVSGDPK